MEKRTVKSNIKISKLRLFEKHRNPKISLSFVVFQNINSFDNNQNPKIFQIKDSTNPKRNVLLNFDLEGRILSIELASVHSSNSVKILEKSFDGRFYVYLENCKNLSLNKDEIYYYYDYYNESIYEDLEISKFLIDSVELWLTTINFRQKNIFKLIKHERQNNLNEDREVLKKVIENCNWKKTAQEKVLLKNIYPTPITVLPPEVRPDQNPIFSVVQITRGCLLKELRGSCKFCSSYKDIHYEEKDREELSEHIFKLKNYIGRNWKYVKKVFLSDADPLYTRKPSEFYFSFLAKNIPEIKWYESFISTPCILSKSEKEWIRLKELGLKKVYWGVESANDETLKILGKAHSNKSLYKAASVFKKIELDYVVILLSGIGKLDGKMDNNNFHVEESSEFVNKIDCKDVYISRFVPQSGTEIFNLLKENKLFFPSTEDREIEHRALVKDITYKANNFLKPARNVKGTYGIQFNNI